MEDGEGGEWKGGSIGVQTCEANSARLVFDAFMDAGTVMAAASDRTAAARRRTGWVGCTARTGARACPAGGEGRDAAISPLGRVLATSPLPVTAPVATPPNDQETSKEATAAALG